MALWRTPLVARGRLSVGGAVDRLQGCSDVAPLLSGSRRQGLPNQVHNAGLDLSIREDSADRQWEALQPIDDRDQHVGDAAVAQLVHHSEPELGALGLLDL